MFESGRHGRPFELAKESIRWSDACRLRQTTGQEIGYSSNRTLNPTATQLRGDVGYIVECIHDNIWCRFATAQLPAEAGGFMDPLFVILNLRLLFFTQGIIHYSLRGFGMFK